MSKAPLRRPAALAAALLLAAGAASAGNFTSAAELGDVRVAADGGVAPHASDRDQLMTDARRTWRWGSVSGEFVTTETNGTKRCHPSSNPSATDYLVDGAPDAYAKVVGSFLSGNPSLAGEARQRVLDLVDTRGFHGLSGDYSGSNQCVLELAISIPIWIETAMLLEESSAWSAADGTAFRAWLANEVFPKVAWASRVRRNNWGTAGSAAAYIVARYVEGSISQLREVKPTALVLSPGAAAAAHVEMQRLRIGNTWEGDSRCDALGVQPQGGIPEELRRGSTGCDGGYLLDDDRSHTYQTMHVQLLVLHAEAMRAHGDISLYDQALASGGGPAILQAILFVIDNPSRSFAWPDSRQGALNVASTWYGNAAIEAEAKRASTFRGGVTLPYTRLTHRGIAAPPEVADDVPLGVPGKPILSP